MRVVEPQTMKQVTVDSSAISNFSFNYDSNLLGVVYHSNPEKCYLFSCDDIEDVEKQLMEAESVGKTVFRLRKENVLKTYDNY